MEVPGELPVGDLHRALELVDGQWCTPSTFAATGVHHRYARITLVNAGYWWPAAEAFAEVLEEFAPVRECWLSRISPGGFIVPHRDGAPWFERWQVPIHTAGVFTGYHPAAGKPFRVEHWKTHSVWNDTNHDRIHLVIDRDIRLDFEPMPFATYPIPDEHAAMVAAAKE